MKDIFLAEMEEGYIPKGILVRELKNAQDYPLRGLPHPLKSGMNHQLDLERYFHGRTSLRVSEKIILKRYHPEFYRKFQNKINKENNFKKSFLERIFGF